MAHHISANPECRFSSLGCSPYPRNFLRLSFLSCPEKRTQPFLVGSASSSSSSSNTLRFSKKSQWRESPESAPQRGQEASTLSHHVPYNANASLIVESWGTIHTGPTESKYWNSTKTYPYPVGYCSVKTYKGRQYRQSIERGTQGPIFIVEEIGKATFSSDSPQKVWNKVVQGDGHHVQGARHFGFQNPDVVRLLKDLVRLQKNGNHAEAEHHSNVVDVGNAVHISNVLMADASRKSVNELVDEGKDEDEEQDRELDDDETVIDADNEEHDDQIFSDGEEHVTEDGYNADVIYTENEDDDADNVTNWKLDEDSILQSVEEHPVDSGSDDENEDDVYSRNNHVPFDTYAPQHGRSQNRKLPIFSSRDSFLSKYKEDANSSRYRKSNVVEGSYEGDMIMQVQGIPKFRSPAASQRRVWRKVDQHTPSDSIQVRASTAFGYNGLKSLDFRRRREESSKSSHMLLELLQKWNKLKKWSVDQGEKLQDQTETKRSQVKIESVHNSFLGEERASMLHKMSPSQGPARETYLGRISKGKYESVLDELERSDEIDESTDYAISRLFEAVGKRNPKTAETKTSSDISKEIDTDSVYSDYVGRGSTETSSRLIENLIHEMDIEPDKNPNVIKKTEDNPRIPRFRTKKAINAEITESKFSDSREMISDTNGISLMKSKLVGGDSMRLINGASMQHDKHGTGKTRVLEEIKILIANKRFEDSMLAIKRAESSGWNIHEDAFEVLLGIRLDSWQTEVFQHVQNGNSVLVSAVPGAGKSAAAEFCLYRSMLDQQRTIFVTTYEHLAIQKFQKLRNIFGPEKVWGAWTKTKPEKNQKLMVTTLEALMERILDLNSLQGSEYRFFLEDIDLIVLDRFHTLGESNYSNLWEQLLMFLDSKIRVIALTLPSSNEEEIVSWIQRNRGTCKLVSHKLEPVSKRYFFCDGCKLVPLLDINGTQLNSALSGCNESSKDVMSNEQHESFFWVGYDRPSLKHALGFLEEKAMLPGLLVLTDVQGCNEVLEDGLVAYEESMLSRQELAELEAHLGKRAGKLSDLLEHIDQKDLEALRKGFAVCHEGKMPVWQNFVLDLFQKNILKLLIVTEGTLLHTGVVARTLILPATCKVSRGEVHHISYHQALQLFGTAGRRGYDIEGNVLFLKNFYTGPTEMASLVVNNGFKIISGFKPSYSLMLNLVVKHNLSQAKIMLENSFRNFVHYPTGMKKKRLQDLDLQILRCLEQKADFELKLFHGLSEINKRKLSDAAMFTFVDVRMTIHSASQIGSTFPAFLIAVVPGQVESLYMVLGADNNFRLLPAGALDHVYVKELPPLDVLYKQSTGLVLQPPVVPSKESWRVEHCGYVANGNSHSKVYVNLLMDHLVRQDVAKEGVELRDNILISEGKISNLLEEKRSLLSGVQTENDKFYIPERIEGSRLSGDESETWREALRLLSILQKLDACIITHGSDTSDGELVKLKPLGMLISRLHNVDNGLWLAVVLTCSSVKHLLPAEFAGIIGSLMPSEPDGEGLFNDPREYLYRITKPLKDAFVNLESLRKQMAIFQGSYNPPLHLNPALGSMVYTWARGKPGTVGFNMKISKDGEISWKLQNAMKFANLVSKACSQASIDIAGTNEFSKISVVAGRAAELIARHLTDVDKNV